MASVLLWTWIAAVAIALIVLIVAGARLFGQLGGLRRAAAGLQRRQSEAMRVQAGAAELQQTLAGLQERAETLQQRMAALSPEK